MRLRWQTDQRFMICSIIDIVIVKVVIYVEDFSFFIKFHPIQGTQCSYSQNSNTEWGVWNEWKW